MRSGTQRVRYKYIFSVVLYRNMDDVIEMIESVRSILTSAKIILVNNYYDDSTLERARKIAVTYDCVLVESENKGYGAGNNCALEYAQKHYIFEYYIVANPDITIEAFDEQLLEDGETPAIYAPRTICKTGKQQNPMWVTRNGFIEWLQYEGEKHEYKILDLAAIVFRKIQRELFLHANKNSIKKRRIYAAHGAFCIISSTALEKLGKPYNENMFLFFEEAWLANNAFVKKIPVYFIPTIVIRHKEDGSMRISNVNQNQIAHKSMTYYYEHKRV